MTQLKKENIFQSLGLRPDPIFLAPLAGVSDIPFRRVCSDNGADLTYVEMLSAIALVYKSKRTFEMMARHPDEKKLGVQVTAKAPDDMAKAIEIINQYPFETVDINMGCPVRKVVGHGCGAAVLRDPELAHAITKAAVSNSNRPVSVKFRLGWDRQSLNFLEIASAVQSAGAAWLTIHGRTRSDDYSREVDLEAIASIKKHIDIPLLGNGNIFCREDYELMKSVTGVDGVMVSRGALGNPWIFRELRVNHPLKLSEWRQSVEEHLLLQESVYGHHDHGVVMMRKHLLWYLKGWPLAKKYRDILMGAQSFSDVRLVLSQFMAELGNNGELLRANFQADPLGPQRFQWNPKGDLIACKEETLQESCTHIFP